MKLTHVQVQQQLEAQQAQHAAQVEDMSSKAAQMESLIRQATELDQQHVTELNARETDLDELRQVDRVYVQSQVCMRVCMCVCVCVSSSKFAVHQCEQH
jgi:TolA-binding protein